MTHTPVSSSFIASLGYDPEARELHVEMQNGKTYSYTGVEPEQHEALINAPSIGAHYGRHIKPNFEGRVVK